MPRMLTTGSAPAANPRTAAGTLGASANAMPSPNSRAPTAKTDLAAGLMTLLGSSSTRGLPPAAVPSPRRRSGQVRRVAVLLQDVLHQNPQPRSCALPVRPVDGDVLLKLDQENVGDGLEGVVAQDVEGTIVLRERAGATDVPASAQSAGMAPTAASSRGCRRKSRPRRSCRREGA